MKKIYQATLILLFTTAVFTLQAQSYYTFIEANNVKARVNTTGLWFNDLNFNGYFEVPNGSGKSSIFASSLWLGALDGNNNLHVAAQTYRQNGNDFITGPLDRVSGMPVDSVTYDKLWHITWKDKEDIRDNWVTDNVKDWPDVYTTSTGTYQLAPFYDTNNNGIMEPELYEYPIFPGDEAIFFVHNDITAHTETGGLPLGVEIKGFIYEYIDTNEFLDNAVFTDYYITNAGKIKLKNVYAGIWTDFDLGNYADDRTGTDSTRNMYYTYNADGDDEGPLGYGTHPPAAAVLFLGIPLVKTMSYDNGFTGMGNPKKAQDYYNLLSGKWSDGSPLTEGDSGYMGAVPANFMYSGNPNTNTGWVEKGVVKDGRMIGSVYFDSLNPGEMKHFTVAYLWTRDITGTQGGSLYRLFNQADDLRKWYAKETHLSVPEIPDFADAVKLYPNPASGIVSIGVPDGFGAFKVGVYDMQGRKIISSESTERIDISSLSVGLYIVRLKKGQYLLTKSCPYSSPQFLT